MKHEVSAEPYSANKEKDKEDVLNEAIDAATNDLILDIMKILDPKMLVIPRFLVRQEAVERIKKFL